MAIAVRVHLRDALHRELGERDGDAGGVKVGIGPTPAMRSTEVLNMDILSSIRLGAADAETHTSGESLKKAIKKEIDVGASSSQVRSLVDRQAQAWEKRDFAIAADDWLPEGELFASGGHVVKEDIQSAILDYFEKFTDLKVTVNEIFLSGDGTRLAIQWDWTVTRKRDHKRATTHDAILVHLVGGKIATWTEYFR